MRSGTDATPELIDQIKRSRGKRQREEDSWNEYGRKSGLSRERFRDLWIQVLQGKFPRPSRRPEPSDHASDQPAASGAPHSALRTPQSEDAP